MLSCQIWQGTPSKGKFIGATHARGRGPLSSSSSSSACTLSMYSVFSATSLQQPPEWSVLSQLTASVHVSLWQSRTGGLREPKNISQFMLTHNIPSVLWHSRLGDRQSIQCIEILAPAILEGFYLKWPIGRPGLTGSNLWKNRLFNKL